MKRRVFTLINLPKEMTKKIDKEINDLKMKYVFFGTPNFAAIILGKLINAGLPPVAIVCNPDRPISRKKIVTPPPVKQLIANSKLPIEIFQPENLKEIQQKLSFINADIFIVAAYAKILPKGIIELPKLGTIGVHPSLLPKYRGSTPIQSVILNGGQETGTTLFLIDEKIDHGAILAASRLPIIAGDNYEILLKKIAELSGNLLVKTLPLYVNEKITPQTQNEAEATYTKKLATQDAFIDLDKDTPESIMRKIHALNPEPGTWTTLNGKRTKILEAEIIEEKLKLKKIQVEGKKPTTL